MRQRLACAFVPSPLAGEGTMVCARIRMGEGFSQSTPSPISTCSSSELPSPARGEGAVTLTAFVAFFTFQTAYLVPAAHVCAGVCTLLRSPRIEGWAERRETFGCVRGTRGTRRNAAYQALARRLASHDAGRSPLGAPPWRFWASGPRFRLLRRPPSYNGGQLPSAPCSELLAARS